MGQQMRTRRGAYTPADYWTESDQAELDLRIRATLTEISEKPEKLNELVENLVTWREHRMDAAKARSLR